MPPPGTVPGASARIRKTPAEHPDRNSSQRAKPRGTRSGPLPAQDDGHRGRHREEDQLGEPQRPPQREPEVQHGQRPAGLEEPRCRRCRGGRAGQQDAGGHRHQAASVRGGVRSASDVPVADQLGQGHRGDDPARAGGSVERQASSSCSSMRPAVNRVRLPGDPVAGVEVHAVLADVRRARPAPGGSPTLAQGPLQRGPGRGDEVLVAHPCRVRRGGPQHRALQLERGPEHGQPVRGVGPHRARRPATGA